MKKTVNGHFLVFRPQYNYPVFRSNIQDRQRSAGQRFFDILIFCTHVQYTQTDTIRQTDVHVGFQTI